MQSFTPPAAGQGTVTNNGNGLFMFTPAAGFVGTAMFSYAAADAYQTSSPATVTITANAAPVAPTVLGVQVNYGSAQRSIVDRLTVAFSTVVKVCATRYLLRAAYGHRGALGPNCRVAGRASLARSATGCQPRV